MTEVLILFGGLLVSLFVPLPHWSQFLIGAITAIPLARRMWKL